MVCTYHFSKKKKWQLICGNATIFFPSYFGNTIATNSFPQYFFFSFYFGYAIVTNLLPQFFSPLFRQCHCHKSIVTFFFFKEMICAYYFYNIFITNPKWQVVNSCYCWIKKVISVLNSNLNQ